MKSRPVGGQPASQRDYTTIRLVNIPSGSGRECVLFKDVMPASSPPDVLLKDTQNTLRKCEGPRFFLLSALRNFALGLMTIRSKDACLAFRLKNSPFAFVSHHAKTRAVPCFRWPSTDLPDETLTVGS
jgi:hypothetical protein